MSSEEQIQHLWTIGSYADIGRDFLGMAAHLVEAAGVEPGERVLDVACGTGNVAITAARRGADATGLDITPAMLADAEANAEIAGVDVDWREGNAVDLPFADDAFDVTLSCVGHVFANPPEAAGRELLRVTRPGGRLAFTSWTPTSLVPAMATAMQPYLPERDDDSPPPVRWGDPDVVADRLGAAVTDRSFETGTVDQFELSPEHAWEMVVEKSGLFIAAMEQVDEADRASLRADVVEGIAEYFDDRRNTLTLEYGLTTATVA